MINEALNKFNTCENLRSESNDDLKRNICRKDLYIWALETEALVKVISAHFQRILDVIPLTSDNCVITSSLDRSIKVRVMLSQAMMIMSRSGT